MQTDAVMEQIRGGYKKVSLKSANYGLEHNELIVEVSARNDINTEVIENIKKYADVISVNWILEMGEHVG